MNSKSISIWEGTANAPGGFKTFTGNADADVVIIGGGITGLTAAMLLSDAGKKVMVLEALTIGLGTTGNSTGNLYVTVDEHLSGIKKKWNADTMKTVVKSRMAAIHLIEKTIGRFAIDCDFYRTTFNYFTEQTGKETDSFIDDEMRALEEAGIQTTVSSNANTPFPVKKIMSFDGQAQFHPLNYVRGLANGISSRCEIFENSQVIDFDEKEGIVKTAGGTIKAKHIIMATHTPKGVYGVQTLLGPYREHGVAAELKSGECPRGIFWSIEQPKHSVRSYSRNGKNYVMVIGDKYKTGQGENTNAYVAGLEDFLRQRFDIGEITYRWGGQQYRPADGLPYIGRHGDKLYFITGLATDGLVYGTLGAAIVSDLVLGNSNEWESLYKLGRFTPAKSFKEFFSENVNNMAQYLKDTPWNRDADSIKDLMPGQARIVEMHGEKLAVYRDDTGTDHVCSAVCTHMKCVVNWNPAEKTWDCPCHGSRFSIAGKVLEGPAVTGLPFKKI
jgi:glycine/D-amino acid oxidase-like deaminating enzyme/nitrite reductase/ring-hydroxylating ferredoxin subunit